MGLKDRYQIMSPCYYLFPKGANKLWGELSEYDYMIQDMQDEFDNLKHRDLARKEETKRLINMLQFLEESRYHCTEKDTESKDTDKGLNDAARAILIILWIIFKEKETNLRDR